MLILLDLIIAVIICLLIVSGIIWFCDGRDYPKIKLIEFIKLYYADKEKWNIYQSNVAYKEDTGRYDHWGDTIYKYHAFRFGYFEFLAYFCWYHYNQIMESRNKDKEAYEEFRKVVYKDE